MTLIEAAKQALEAWQTSVYGSESHHKAALFAMTNMAQTIEEAEKQEPHSWYSAEHDEWMTNKTRKEHEELNSYTHKVGGFDLPLYTTPPAAPVIDKSAAIRIATALGWTPPAAPINSTTLMSSTSEQEEK